MRNILVVLVCVACLCDGHRLLASPKQYNSLGTYEASQRSIQSLASQLLSRLNARSFTSSLVERTHSRRCIHQRCKDDLVMLEESDEALQKNQDVEWHPLPHVNRAKVVRSVTATAASMMLPKNSLANEFQLRTAASIDSHLGLPVWPVWPTFASPTGGRVVPVSLDPSVSDPFLLIAHHRHSFSPGDPLRGPFKAIGGALGLPYVGDEGFALHPHRGIDILTYVLDGSDGFRHKDSLGGECTYRGGACQFMRSGRGAMHEEMWETRQDRSTKIELFQIWINLPRNMKMSPPAIRYIGNDFGAPYIEDTHMDSNGVPTRVRTIDQQLLLEAPKGEGETFQKRPDMKIRHATIEPGGVWTAKAPREHTALCYVRKGAVQVNGQILGEVKAGSTCLFDRDGDLLTLVNRGTTPADLLLLTGQPLREPVALGGPIVMNTEAELEQAYHELRSGTFLS